ncbi:hypothetical protein [Pseudoalteromonas sp.]|uniref:hypothetical protein n=1 Tax=Pseudoalteromonas sp. TaxID=53249 RepID=UPI002613DEEF|nr:hypothetical protein [Pseudoalteromonas sp.]MCP4586908.1 hypothetical protein [Pseudoalteromonas sp.]
MNERFNERLTNKYYGCLEPKDCYGNSIFVGQSEHLKKEVYFILGTLICDDGECPHAWLKINDVEVDPTAIFLPDNSKYNAEITIPMADSLKIGTAKISQLWNRRIDPNRHQEFDWGAV